MHNGQRLAVGLGGFGAGRGAGHVPSEASNARLGHATLTTAPVPPSVRLPNDTVAPDRSSRVLAMKKPNPRPPAWAAGGAG